MKPFFFYLLLVLATTFGYTQSTNKFNQFDSSVRKVKKTTTIFVINPQYSKADFKAMLKSVWTVTPFEVIYNNDFNIVDYANPKYSIISLGVSYGVKQINTGSVTHTTKEGEFYYEFLYLKLNESTKLNSAYAIYKHHVRSIGSFKLYGNYMVDPSYYHKPLKPDNASTRYDALYQPYLFTNYNLPQLKMEFKKLNLLVENNVRERDNKGESFMKKYTKGEIKTLASDTLYIPYGLHKRSYLKYKYPYKIISSQDLNDKLLSGQSIKYLRITSKEHLGYTLNKAEVIDSKTGVPMITITTNRLNSFYPKLFERINRKIAHKL